jgi:2-polyprenyl-3-methyl-5-hydroxy-6-metoxy-1,4-benzoquinol methylase
VRRPRDERGAQEASEQGLSSRLNVSVPNFDGRAYQARFDALAEKGADVHGEASLVRSLGPSSVLDAGCGTGRVAIELARHGVGVVGVDLDASMIVEARRRAPELEWVEGDLAALALGRQFDVVVMAGNVPLFCPQAKRSALVKACAAHVAPGGALVAGFELGRGYGLDDYDSACLATGLVLADRWATWDRQPFQGAEFHKGSEYAVSVHRHPSA